MIHKLPLSPLSSTRGTPLLRSRLVYYSGLLLSQTQGYVNWSLVFGVAVMMLVSATGWVGIALLTSHIWK
jgi:hypothetical protein